MTVDELIVLIGFDVDKEGLRTLRSIGDITDDASDSINRLGGRIDGAGKNFGKATKATDLLSDSLKRVALGAAAAFSAGKVMQYIMTGADEAKHLKNMAEGLDVNAAELHLWGTAMRAAGHDAKAFYSDLEGLRKTYGQFDLGDAMRDADTLKETFETLGMPEALNHGDALGYSPDSVRFLVQGSEEIQNALQRQRDLGNEVTDKQVDIVTTLHIQSGRREAVMADVNRAWAKGVQVRTIVEEIAKTMAGVNVDPVMIKGVTGTVGESGMPISADAETALNQLSRQYGFYWSIVDGRFQTVSRDAGNADGIQGRGVAIDDESLISASAVLHGVRRVQRGIVASCMFNPLVRPGGSVIIRSAADPQANGEWRVTRAAHNLGTFEPRSFITEIEGVGRRRPVG